MTGIDKERELPRTHLITGAAGFIGANLARRLLDDGDRVIGVDDLSRGVLPNLAAVAGRPAFELIQLDCSDGPALIDAVRACGASVDIVWHLAANSDIPAGIEDQHVDVSHTFMTTVGVLDAVKACAIPRLHFASSSAVYGDHGETAIAEDIGPLHPISNYGAMKLASEVLIRAATEAFLPRAEIYRFPNVVGTPATHGVLLDFVRKLHVTPDELVVLGDGTQRKAYLHVDALLDAMMHIGSLTGEYLVFNIGPHDDGVTVREIAEAVRDAVAPAATVHYGVGERGWVGDVPRFRYSLDRLSASGWTPPGTSRAAIDRAIAEIVMQERSG